MGFYLYLIVFQHVYESVAVSNLVVNYKLMPGGSPLGPTQVKHICFKSCNDDNLCTGFSHTSKCSNKVCNLNEPPAMDYVRSPVPCCTLGFHIRGNQGHANYYTFIDKIPFPVDVEITHIEFYAARVRSLEFGLFRAVDVAPSNPSMSVLEFEALPNLVVGFNRVGFSPPKAAKAGDYYGFGWRVESVVEMTGSDVNRFWHSLHGIAWPVAGSTIPVSDAWGQTRFAFVVYYCGL